MGTGTGAAKSGGGNVLQSYAYDFEKHMVQANGPGGILGTYYYNADGLRVAKVTATGTIRFIYDDMKLLQELSSTGQATATYTSTGGSVNDALLGIANSAGSHVALVDGLGSTRFLLDSTQNVSDAYVYEAFGRQVSGSGETPNPYHFVGVYGYYQDWETGLLLLTARYYDAEAGRFVTRDPIGFGGGDWNIHGYVDNGPTSRSDPSGLLGLPPWLISTGLTVFKSVKNVMPIYRTLSAAGCGALGIYTFYLALNCLIEVQNRANQIAALPTPLPDDCRHDLGGPATLNYGDCFRDIGPAVVRCATAMIGWVIKMDVRPPAGS